jgi:hypothetical protein
MRMSRKIIPAVIAAVLALGLSGAAFAQGDPNAQVDAGTQVDPPGRVARLNFTQGIVSFLPSGGGEKDWIAASPNRPVTIGDKVWVDNAARAELHIGSSAIRLDQNTGISFLNLDDNSVQLQFTDGSLLIRVRDLAPSESYEVDTPNLAFTIQSPGEYRVDTNTDGNRTVVTVRQGQGEVTGGGRSYTLETDQQAVFTGTDKLEYDLLDADAQPMNDFDRWGADMDHKEDHLASAAYVSPDVTGAQDLDTYGSWSDVPGYGHAWAPAGVAVGWAPYRFGHWVWITPWGWTWVEDEPWGFAPFHYGRWAFYQERWFWVPGPLGPRPYYAPALVAWVGGGPGLGFSIGIGAGVAWFPLGPRDVFVPSYRVSTEYVTRVNVTNTFVDRTTVVNVYNNGNVRNVTYANQHVPGGITAVSHETFVKGQPVARNAVQISGREAMTAPVSRQFPANPEAESFRGGAPTSNGHPSVAIVNRPVVGKHVPPGPPAQNGFAGSPGNNGNNAPPNFSGRGAAGSGNSNGGGNTGNRGNTGNSGAPPNPGGNAAFPKNGQPPTPNPQVKPAPPVQPPTPQQKANEDAKKKTWQDAHPRPPKKDGKGN